MAFKVEFKLVGSCQTLMEWFQDMVRLCFKIQALLEAEQRMSAFEQKTCMVIFFKRLFRTVNDL